MIRSCACAIALVLLLPACGSRVNATSPLSSETTTQVATDPCAPSAGNPDPCGSEYDFWLEKFSSFDEELSHAIVVLGRPTPPQVILRPAIDPACCDEDPLSAVDKLRSCSENLRFIREPPGGASRHPESTATMATYANACPKFEAAAAVFDEAFKSNSVALIVTGQRLIKEGEAILCSGRIHCPSG
jgi:hypothetical protein